MGAVTARIETVRTVDELRAQVAAWRRQGLRIALVPTMGALHEGHLSLVELALGAADRVVVSIFVNPTQFGPEEDFATYPRSEAQDRAKLAALGAHLVFAPGEEEMFAPDFSTEVFVAGVSEGLCGASRPHFFAGVATIVAKLLNQCQPDIAVFGEKDYQQLLVIRRMVRDLDMPVDILAAPIVRDSDGLALSSRNAYLSAAERQIAPLLHRAIADMAQDVAEGRPMSEALEAARRRLEGAGFEVDYLEIRGAADLVPFEGEQPDRPARVFAAAWLGRTRLIDNVPVPTTGTESEGAA